MKLHGHCQLGVNQTLIELLDIVLLWQMYLWQKYYGKCNYGKHICGKTIMENVTELFHLFFLSFHVNHESMVIHTQHSKCTPSLLSPMTQYRGLNPGKMETFTISQAIKGLKAYPPLIIKCFAFV